MENGFRGWVWVWVQVGLGWWLFSSFFFGMEFWALQKRMDCIEDHEAHSLCPWEWQNWGSGIEELYCTIIIGGLS
jgi:hypothetical protein